MTRKTNSICAPIGWQRSYLENEDRKGFTLVEVLVAITIGALLVTTVLGAFRGVFLPTEALTFQRRTTAMALSCLDRMAIDLQNIQMEQLYDPTSDNISETSPRQRFAAGDTLETALPQVVLQLVSKTHITARPAARPELAVIRYYLESDQRSSPTVYRLRRSDTLLLADTDPELEEDPIVCDHIETLHIQGIDADGASHPNWDSTAPSMDDATPRAVAIQLELKSPAGTRIYRTTVSLPVWRNAG